MTINEFAKLMLLGAIVLVVGSLTIAACVKFGPRTIYKLRYGKFLTEEYKDVIVLDVRVYGKEGAFLVVETEDFARFLLEDWKIKGAPHVQGDVIPLRTVVNSQTGRVDYFNHKSLEFTYIPA